MPESTNQKTGMVFGVIYLLVGVLGFLLTGFSNFAGTQGKTLILFDVNPLHNIVHLGVGAALFLAARASLSSSRTVNTLVGAVYLLVGIVGFFLIGGDANILAINQPDNFLHLASAAVLLAVGLRKETAVA